MDYKTLLVHLELNGDNEGVLKIAGELAERFKAIVPFERNQGSSSAVGSNLGIVESKNMARKMVLSPKQAVTKDMLEKLVVKEAAGEWGCEDLTGVTIEKCDQSICGRNWTVTHLQNEDLPAGGRTVMRIVDRLGQHYDLSEN